MVHGTGLALGQTSKDFSLTFVPAGIPVPSGQAAIGLLVNVDQWTEAEPFVVRLTVPPELEITSHCEGDTAYDAATRVFTWTGHLENPFAVRTACPFTFSLAPLLPPGTVYTLKAMLTTTMPDSNPANNAVSTFGIVTKFTDLGLTISADTARLKPGATLAYTFTMTNRGPHEGHSVILTDQLSPDVTFVSFEQVDGPPSVFDATPKQGSAGSYVQANIGILGIGSSATYRMVVRVKPSIEAANIRTRADVASLSTDLSLSDNSRELLVFAGPSADLALVETIGKEAEGQIRIAVEVSNDGPDRVNAVKIENTFQTREGRYDFVQNVRIVSATPSQGTCSAPQVISLIGSPDPPPMWGIDCAIGALEPGGRATVVLIVERTARAGRFTHHAFVSPDQNDPKPANNTIDLLLDTASRKRATRR